VAVGILSITQVAGIAIGRLLSRCVSRCVAVLASAMLGQDPGSSSDGGSGDCDDERDPGGQGAAARAVEAIVSSHDVVIMAFGTD
jgi:hypothetical protein